MEDVKCIELEWWEAADILRDLKKYCVERKTNHEKNYPNEKEPCVWALDVEALDMYLGLIDK